MLLRTWVPLPGRVGRNIKLFPSAQRKLGKPLFSEAEPRKLEMTLPSVPDVKNALQLLLAKADLSTATESSLEKSLHDQFQCDMSAFRSLIQVRLSFLRNSCDRVLLSERVKSNSASLAASADCRSK